MNCDDSFYGSVTIGERGQIVIPAEARAELGYQPGDKLLVLKHPIYDGLMICKIESLQSMLDGIQETIQNANKKHQEESK
jgi:AbrB family looped-hinge helix DNA binding protein